MELKQLKQREANRAKNKALIKSGRLIIKHETEKYPSGNDHTVVNVYLDAEKIMCWGYEPKDIMSVMDFEKMADDFHAREKRIAEIESEKNAYIEAIKKEAEKHGFKVAFENDYINIVNEGGEWLHWVDMYSRKPVSAVIEETEKKQAYLINYAESVKMLNQSIKNGDIENATEKNDRFIITDNKNRELTILKESMERNARRFDLVKRVCEEADTIEANEANQKQADQLQAIKVRESGLKAVFDGERWTIKFRNSHLLTSSTLTHTNKPYWELSEVADFIPNREVVKLLEEMSK